jgi:signal peptidase I
MARCDKFGACLPAGAAHDSVPSFNQALTFVILAVGGGCNIIATLSKWQWKRGCSVTVEGELSKAVQPIPDAVVDTPPDVQSKGIPRPPVRSRAMWHDIRDTIVMVLAIYTLVNLIAPRYIVEGASMAPNFETGEWIIVSRLPYLLGEPQRGDVVVLDFPEPQDDLIKRVVGLPGETVEIHDGLVFVDGAPISEPYINAQPRYSEDPVTLGPDEFFVLGDNRNNSRDSHSFGAVDRDKIIGRAWLIYWPPPNWTIIPQVGYGTSAVVTATPTPTPTSTPTLTPTYAPPAP